MPNHDVFLLQNSGLEPFLWAELGTEQNGSRLTLLSALARLDLDPWAEAARWVGMPRAAVIERLAACIAGLPLCPPQALPEARRTASRLVGLLPTQVPAREKTRRNGGSTASRASGIPAIVFYCALAFGLAVNLMMMPKQTDAGAAAQGLTQAVHPEAARP